MDRSVLVPNRGSNRFGAPLAGLILAAALFEFAPMGVASVRSASIGSGGEAQQPTGTRPDQVYVHDAKSDRRSVVTGTVTENSLSKVVVQREGKESKLEPLEVDLIVWGEVSPAFREAKVFYERGDYENAAAKYRQATDVDERAVVKAEARHRAGESLLQLGATDPSKYAEALTEFGKFLEDHPDDRAVPEVRSLQARATLLNGDAAAAGALYRSLFESGSGQNPKPGYDRILCLQAGLAAGQALLAANDTLGAREVFGVLESGISSLQPQLAQGSPESQELARLAAEADLGEGYLLIAGGQPGQAETFFEARLRNADKAGATTRFGAMMGLAEAYAAGHKSAEARVLFARVASIDFTNRDRTARALLRLAQTTVELKEPESAANARKWLNDIVTYYGNTPSARAARENLN